VGGQWERGSGGGTLMSPIIGDGNREGGRWGASIFRGEEARQLHGAGGG
jgi:hypothetical protein